MESRKSCRPLAAAASLFNLWFVNQSSLQIVQPCGQLIDVIVAALSFCRFLYPVDEYLRFILLV